MREKLFRGKRKDNGKWVESDCIMQFDKDIINGRGERTIKLWDKEGWTYIDKNTFGEFTGEHDKRYKRIFEGDFLKDDNGFIYQVIFENGGFCLVAVSDFDIPYDTLPKDGDLDEFQGEMADNVVPISSLKWNDTEWNGCFVIIGNIHDNPELLEVNNG